MSVYRTPDDHFDGLPVHTVTKHMHFFLAFRTLSPQHRSSLPMMPKSTPAFFMTSVADMAILRILLSNAGTQHGK